MRKKLFYKYTVLYVLSTGRVVQQLAGFLCYNSVLDSLNLQPIVRGRSQGQASKAGQGFEKKCVLLRLEPATAALTADCSTKKMFGPSVKVYAFLRLP